MLTYGGLGHDMVMLEARASARPSGYDQCYKPPVYLVNTFKAKHCGDPYGSCNYNGPDNTCGVNFLKFDSPGPVPCGGYFYRWKQGRR